MATDDYVFGKSYYNVRKQHIAFVHVLSGFRTPRLGVAIATERVGSGNACIDFCHKVVQEQSTLRVFFKICKLRHFSYYYYGSIEGGCGGNGGG